MAESLAAEVTAIFAHCFNIDDHHQHFLERQQQGFGAPTNLDANRGNNFDLVGANIDMDGPHFEMREAHVENKSGANYPYCPQDRFQGPPTPTTPSNHFKNVSFQVNDCQTHPVSLRYPQKICYAIFFSLSIKNLIQIIF